MGGEGSSLNTQAYRVEVSNDGQNWQEILRVENNSSGLTEDAVPVTQGRYVRLLIDEPTQGGDSAARIYEVEVRGLDKEINPAAGLYGKDLHCSARICDRACGESRYRRP